MYKSIYSLYTLTASLIVLVAIVGINSCTSLNKKGKGTEIPVASLPKMKVGDSWEWKVIGGVYDCQGIVKFKSVVVSVNKRDASFVVESSCDRNKILEYFNSKYNREKVISLETGERILFSCILPPLLLDFPLFVGKRWEEQGECKSIAGFGVISIVSSYMVDKYETVTTDLGNYKAYKIVRLFSPSSRSRTHQTTYWYSPELKNIIKTDHKIDTKNSPLIQIRDIRGAEIISCKIPDFDSTSPVIEILSPEIELDTDFIEPSTKNLKGVVKDKHKIMWLKINGEEINLNRSGGFYYQIPSSIPNDVVELTASDAFGNIASRSIQFRKYFSANEKLEDNHLKQKLASLVKEKRELEERLKNESEVKEQLEASLAEREMAFKKQKAIVTSLYEKERQLKDKLFLLNQTNIESDDKKKEIEFLKRKSEEINNKLRKKQYETASSLNEAQKKLVKILETKSILEEDAENLRKKEVRLRNEVNNLKVMAEKTRQEAKNSKEELVLVRKREDQLNKQLEELKKRISRGMAPVVVISQPKKGVITTFPSISLHLIVVDDKAIEDIVVSVNGIPVNLDTKRGIKITGIKKDRLSNKIDIVEKIQLQYGQNTILVSAKDTEGMKTEEAVDVFREKEQGNIFGIVIGINEYQNTRNLKYAVNDALSFKSYLKDYIGIPEKNVFSLIDQEATRVRVQSLLGTQLKKKVGYDDTVIIFYAGHGGVETDPANPDGDGYEKYLLPHDADLSDLYSTSISMKEIKTIFQRIRSERLIFIADTCYSGASGGRTMLAGKTRATLSEKFFERVSKGKGRVIISSCSANEISKEDDNLKHGLFTFYMLKGLKGEADYDEDGIITVSELFGFVSQEVPKASGQDQHPVMKGEIKGELVIGYTK